MYKVRVEADNPEYDLDKKIQEGVDCRGLVIALFDENGDVKTLVIQNVTSMEIAWMMSDNAIFKEAVPIARGILEARRIHNEEEAKERKLDLLRKILCPEGEEDDDE